MHDEQNPIDDPDATTKPEGRARTGIIRSIAYWLAEDDGVLPDEGRLAPFDGATAWLNSAPLTPEGLRGRVVLVDFWTYTCVNWHTIVHTKHVSPNQSHGPCDYERGAPDGSTRPHLRSEGRTRTRA